MECSKEFSLTVSPAALFSWGVATISAPNGTASFTPDSADGNTAVSAVSVNAGGPAPSASSNTGTLIWNSTAVVPANLNVTVASVGVNPDPTLVADLTINVVAPASNLLTVAAGFNIGYNNTLDFPFNLPNTGGADWTITWFHETIALSNPANPGSITITGIFTIV